MTEAEKEELQLVHDGLFGPGTPPVASTATNQLAQNNRGGQRGQTNRFGRFRNGNNNFRGQRPELTGELRRAMRMETEKAFDYILREDRSLLELLDSDYTFVNERLAKHYGITNSSIHGEDMQLVRLEADSPRGGLLGQGTFLTVASNPTRTSPVKRGLFILDSILATPPPPPPPNIPPLKHAAIDQSNVPLPLRERLALHREKPLSNSS